MRKLMFTSLAMLLGAPTAYLIAQPPEEPQAPAAPSPPDSAPALFPEQVRDATTLGTAPSLPASTAVPAITSGQAPSTVWGSPAAQRSLRVGQGELAQLSYYDAANGQAIAYRSMQQPSALEQEAMKIAGAYRDTTDPQQKETLRSQLVEITQKAFDDAMKQRREQVEESKKRLDEITKRLDERQELREDIISRRVASLLDEPDPLDWNFDSPGPRYYPGIAPTITQYLPHTIPTPAPPAVTPSQAFSREASRAIETTLKARLEALEAENRRLREEREGLQPSGR